MLPDRSIKAEDGFLTKMHSADPDTIQEAISEALSEKRPRLAARLVGLLNDEQLEILDPEELARARRAARMLLLQGTDDRNEWYYEAQEFQALWEAARRHKMDLVKRRMRGDNVHYRPRIPRKRR